ncbi:class I SAM-dependent methyltransferase [Ktedonospora formicarum]|uniref:Methyltransferase domain-containing protein n=1 Tax=Ktedonospora formicarum TaxID=2778364 RepID=A0A8J3I7U5_9CHLR|nr:class I SAM-dependent methyltransferase [Ktedonospora formicarum]GHO46299.1 hypothetical protein KSX_44620 [Ktedonospora formicarum]
MINRLFGSKKRRTPDEQPEQFGRAKPLEEIVNQRRYRTDIPYFFPKDINEQDRLNFQHYALRHFLRGNYIAPLAKIEIHDILDVGSGSGIWPQEMAQEFTDAKVVGIDIELPLSMSNMPRNSLLLQGNVLKGLPFQDEAFDFVHERLLAAAIPAQSWQPVVNELARVTRPGGFVEMIEVADVFVNGGPNSLRLIDWWRQAGARTGFDSTPIKNLSILLTHAGITNITHTTLPIPMGKWAGRVGEMMSKDLHLVFNNLRVACAKLGIASEKEYERTWEALPQEWERLQTSFVFFLAYGQKPQA